MASGPDPGGRSRFAKLGMAINEELTQACRDVLEMEVPPGLVYNKVKASSIYKKIRPEQELCLIGAKTNGYKEFDITLLYTLIRNICTKIPRPTKGWGGNTMPSVGEITIGDDIERIRMIRNNMFGHISPATTSQTEFDDTWSVITDVCQRLQTYTKKDYMSGLRYIQSQVLEVEDDKTVIKDFGNFRMENISLEHVLPELKTKPKNKDAINIPPERFMAYMKNGKTTVRHARGIVVGCGGAGKTTLLYRLMGKSLDEIKDIKSTRGLDVYEYIFSVRNGNLIDYLYFWLDSIKSFSGPSSQVLAVATHTEGKTEKEKDSFLESLWTLVTEDDKARLYDKDFALGLMEMNEDGIHVLQSLKESIAKVVSNKIDTKIEVPSAWALLEHLLQTTEKPILSISDIKKENKKLPEEYQLKNQEELFDFLSFFHGHGLLLFFKEEGLRTHALFGIQWFSNAFSNLIADKDHINRDCKRRCIEDWNRFNATGNLSNSLVEALWKGESSYIEHKTILMSYMERLRMLVSIDGEFSWYVPCMNQKPFTHDVFKQTHEKSSILCFRFTSFAMFVYYRLIAYCMSFLKWKVQLDKDKSQCLYHTAAIFETENHTVIVGIIDNDIQVQVLRINDIQLKVSCKIGKSIQIALTELTATFNEKKTFQKGYKCLNLFCSEKDQTFIPEDELSGSQCNCPIGSGKHKIDVQWTLGFWEDRNSCCSTIPVASRPNLDGRSRFAKLGMATNDVLNQAYRDIVELEVLPSVCYTKVQSLPTKLQLYPEQERLLQDAKHDGYKKFDISLSYKIIRNVCSKIPKPTKGRWGQNNMPAPGETTVGDDIERIRLIRNSLTGHVSSASTSQTEFDNTWSLMAGICERLEVFTKKRYMDNLMYIQNLILKEKDEDDIIEKLKKEYDRELLEKINSGVQELATILKPESRDSADYDYYS